MICSERPAQTLGFKASRYSVMLADLIHRVRVYQALGSDDTL